MTQYWLMKTEPDVFSIDDLARKKTAPWDGVRNYQARNFMRDGMRVGDFILFYHSSTEPPGVAGVARVVHEAHPDTSAFDRKSEYYDPKSKREKPTWMMVDVGFVEKFPRFVPLETLRSAPNLSGMMVLLRGVRLSVQPVEAKHFQVVVRMGEGKTKIG